MDSPIPSHKACHAKLCCLSEPLLGLTLSIVSFTADSVVSASCCASLLFPSTRRSRTQQVPKMPKLVTIARTTTGISTVLGNRRIVAPNTCGHNRQVRNTTYRSEIFCTRCAQHAHLRMTGGENLQMPKQGRMQSGDPHVHDMECHGPGTMTLSTAGQLSELPIATRQPASILTHPTSNCHRRLYHHTH